MGLPVPLAWGRGVAAGALVAACLGIAACGSGSGQATPQGLKGTQVGAAANSTYAAENAAAATSLTPAAIPSRWPATTPRRPTRYGAKPRPSCATSATGT
jgi:hypothetical protein